MNIKKEIGNRIRQERNNKGLTRKALANLTDALSLSSINNYERGDRTPGPEEIRQLALVLDISPAYLMCLTNEKKDHSYKLPSYLMPILDSHQVTDPKGCIDAIKNDQHIEITRFIPISPEILSSTGQYIFAYRMNDDGMDPVLKQNDILIIDADSPPKPGHCVLAKLPNNEIVIRKYKQLSNLNNHEFELLPVNPNWAKISIANKDEAIILGRLKAIFREVNSI